MRVGDEDKENCADYGGCSPYATCTDTQNGPQCTCKQGYTGNGYTCKGEN